MLTIQLVHCSFDVSQRLTSLLLPLKSKYLVLGESATFEDFISDSSAVVSPDVVLVDSSFFCHGQNYSKQIKKLSTHMTFIAVDTTTPFRDNLFHALRSGVSGCFLLPGTTEQLDQCLQTYYYTHKQIELQHRSPPQDLLLNITDSYCVLYVIMANPIDTLGTPYHPNVYYVPNPLIDVYFAKALPDTPFFCFDSSFSNEKTILLPIAPKCSIEENLQIFLEDLIKISHEFVTIYYHSFSAVSLPFASNYCRNEAIKHLILGYSGVYHQQNELQFFKKSAIKKATLYSMFVEQQQFTPLHGDLHLTIENWKKELLPYLVLREHLSFILNYLRDSLPLRADFLCTADYLVDNLICFSLNDAEFADNIYNTIMKLFANCLPTTFPSSSELQVKQIAVYLNANLSSSLNLDVLSYEMNLSKAYICRIFKKHTNMTPIDYLNQLKIQQAKELLTLSPPLAIKKIAEYLGYNDVYYFSKVFKKISGISPSQFRTHNEKKSDSMS